MVPCQGPLSNKTNPAQDSRLPPISKEMGETNGQHHQGFQVNTQLGLQTHPPRNFGCLPSSETPHWNQCLRSTYWATAGVNPCPDSLLVSPKNPKRPWSKNALSSLLRKVIDTAMDTVTSHKSHNIRAVATSACFLRNCSVRKVLEAATW